MLLDLKSHLHRMLATTTLFLEMKMKVGSPHWSLLISSIRYWASRQAKMNRAPYLNPRPWCSTTFTSRKRTQDPWLLWGSHTGSGRSLWQLFFTSQCWGGRVWLFCALLLLPFLCPGMVIKHAWVAAHRTNRTPSPVVVGAETCKKPIGCPSFSND